ncbi:MAG: ribonuclease P protein component [Steroidobacteraceae bacterium]
MPESRTIAPPLTLPASRRLRLAREFTVVHAKGLRIGDGFFTMAYTSNNLGAARIGLAISKRAIGKKSVDRNRIRRLIRESFRLNQHQLPAVDVVVSARHRAQGADRAQLRASLESLWKKLAATCESSRSV